MLKFILKKIEKLQAQNNNVENLDQYLNFIENDVKLKIDTMKQNLEKLGEQFIQNIKSIRKEFQK